MDPKERAARYIDKLPPAVAGQNGHDAIYRAACVLSVGFALPEGDVSSLLADWNHRHASPPFSEKELAHKVRQAMKAADKADDLGHLLSKGSGPNQSSTLKKASETSEPRTRRTDFSNLLKGGRRKHAPSRTPRTVKITSFNAVLKEKEKLLDKRISPSPSETSEPSSPSPSHPKANPVSSGPPPAPLSLVRSIAQLMKRYAEAHEGQEPNVVHIDPAVVHHQATFLNMRVIPHQGDPFVDFAE